MEGTNFNVAASLTAFAIELSQVTLGESLEPLASKDDVLTAAHSDYR